MSATIHNRVAPIKFGSKFGSFVFTRQALFPEAGRHGGLLDRLKAWRERGKARDELNRLSDRSLADIGLVRSDIERVLTAGRRRS